MTKSVCIPTPLCCIRLEVARAVVNALLEASFSDSSRITRIGFPGCPQSLIGRHKKLNRAPENFGQPF